jgi:hypothetical protein
MCDVNNTFAFFSCQLKLPTEQLIAEFRLIFELYNTQAI